MPSTLIQREPARELRSGKKLEPANNAQAGHVRRWLWCCETGNKPWGPEVDLGAVRNFIMPIVMAWKVTCWLSGSEARSH